MASTLNRLLSPGTIGCLKLRNRIVLPPMVRSYATPDGMVTRKMVDHYAARAKGGVGMVMIEATSVHPSGKGWHQGVVIDHDKYIPGLNDLTEAVKSWGSRIAVQLHHAGRQTTSVITGMPIVAPSPVPCRVMGGLPRELTTAEVGELVEAFAQAARRAKAAGFDAVEVHGAHGYLVGQFFSPNTNRRTDKYGGDINGRTTFAVEIIRRTRDLVGPNFPIIVRMNATDLVEGGLELDESQQIARILQAAGADALNISVGTYEARLNPDNGSAMGIAAMYVPRGHLVAYAAQIKSQVKIPVITVGSITPAMGEEILKQGKADFIAMGRQLLADPELPNKLMRNDPASIRPCIRCNEFCSGKVPTGVRCSVNAEVGFESYGLKPVFKQKKVLIVGGGPAAMEAARVAAIRGHKVVLYEKNSQLGGHLVEGTVPDFKADLLAYKDWLIEQMEKLGVTVELGKEVTARTLAEVKPDALVMATGSTVYRPDIPGIDRPIVTTAVDVLLGNADPGRRPIVAGGGAVGCELALYLAKLGKKVTIVEMLPALASELPTAAGPALVKLVQDSGVTAMTSAKISSITDKGVTAIVKGQDVVNIDGDKVILALGMVPQAALYEKLKGKAPEVFLIGDCVEAGRVGEATRDGYRVGNAL